MAVHVPLSIEARTEARFLMLSTNNILKLSDGKPVVSPTQDMVIGSYYMTMEKDGGLGEGRYFRNPEEAMMAYQDGQISLQSKIFVRVEKVVDGVKYSKRLHTTIGRIIFNGAIPQDLHFVPRDTPEQQLDLEVDFRVGKKELSRIVDACFKYKGATETSIILDRIKAQGYKYSTVGAITASVFDMHVPPKKKEIISGAEENVVTIEKQFKKGRLTEEDRYKQTIAVWQKALADINVELKKGLDEFNPIWMMANSGARGSMTQISQLCGMKGLVADPSGRTIELPIKASLREGLSVLEYFISSHGGRKGMADTALKTADSGYLTRRLVDVSQDVIVNELDCGDNRGITVELEGENTKEFIERIDGRFVMEDVVDENGNSIIEKDTMATPEQAKAIAEAGVKKVKIRSILMCKSAHGVCAKCYGKNMASGNSVKLGEAVGIIAAQSIGEPGTQLTMRTFHTGGVALSGDITNGLPRVEELFEARRPKGQALVADIAGEVDIDTSKRVLTITSPKGDKVDYKLVFGQKLKVEDGQTVAAGDVLTQGSIYPQDILRTKGVRGVQDYIIKEVKVPYASAGVDINEKHIEIVVRQMLRKVKIENQGDTSMMPGEYVDIFAYEAENEKVIENGGRPATAKRTLLGITKAALATESFLSAASFQETAKVLTEAAIKNKVDHLIGLKENVILGKLIPAGTGMKRYRNIVSLPANSAENRIVEESISDKFALEDDIED
jgi:DNA-directed RNA polymerase subunit beta'